MTVEVVLYGARECGLCDDAKRILEGTREALGFQLRVVDITGDAALEAAYREDIPVVTIDGHTVFVLGVDPAELRRRVLASAADPPAV